MVDGWLRVLMRGENCPIDERRERQRQSDDRALHPSPPESEVPQSGHGIQIFDIPVLINWPTRRTPHRTHER